MSTTNPWTKGAALSGGPFSLGWCVGREHLLVTLRTVSAHWSKRVVANARGAFTVRFTIPVGAGGCQGYSVAAVGSKGDHAAWKSPPKPCGALPGP